jgi:hypothetical protein
MSDNDMIRRGDALALYRTQGDTRADEFPQWDYCEAFERAIAALPAVDVAGVCEEETARKDTAYLERNKLVSLLAAIFPSGIKRTAIEGWSDDWHGCVYINFPWGQASWHYHDSQAYLFEHLPPYEGDWDGHTTEEKYDSIVHWTRNNPHGSPWNAWNAWREEAVQAEREACALEAGNRKHWGYEDDEGHWDDHDPAQVGRQIQKAIRARKGGAA